MNEHEDVDDDGCGWMMINYGIYVKTWSFFMGKNSVEVEGKSKKQSVP